MDQVIQIMKDRHGQDLSCFHRDFLRKTMEKRMQAAGAGTVEAYAKRLGTDPGEAGAFQGDLYVSYSDFYREPAAFHSLSQQMLPEIISRKKDGQEIRIWSAGCAAGQEPYSIAMEADRVIRTIGRKIKVRIFASDISEKNLHQARAGVYRREDLKRVSLGDLDRYFHKAGSAYEISARIKADVDFIQYDILDKKTVSPAESIFGGFDIIFCRNVMIYYAEDCQRRILEKLKHSLAANGYVVTGEAEKGIAERWLTAKPVVCSGPAFTLHQTGGAR